MHYGAGGPVNECLSAFGPVGGGHMTPVLSAGWLNAQPQRIISEKNNGQNLDVVGIFFCPGSFDIKQLLVPTKCATHSHQTQRCDESRQNSSGN